MSNNNLRIPILMVDAIERAFKIDQGAAFRGHLGRVLPHIGDAYRTEKDGFRSHMGASVLGQECSRKIWYGFRWSKQGEFDGRILRLFNRGHLEEGRFIAILLTIGAKVYQQDGNGKQFRISFADGHAGGAGDGVVVGIPEAPETPILLEFKTHNDASFKKLIKEGVQKAKKEHYVQMQLYMRKMGLTCALYGAINKNDDHIHWELVLLDTAFADEYIVRAEQLVYAPLPPRRIATSPTFFSCKWCEFNEICFKRAVPVKTCRSCTYAKPVADGQWQCRLHEKIISPETMQTGCNNYSLLEGFND